VQYWSTEDQYDFNKIRKYTLLSAFHASKASGEKSTIDDARKMNDQESPMSRRRRTAVELRRHR
jgi:hypothetical protein